MTNKKYSKEHNLMDEEQTGLENTPDFSSLKELDPELFTLINNLPIAPPPISPLVRNKVLANYDSYYRYQIFWYGVKVKVKKYKDLIFSDRRRLVGALASIALVVLLGSIYMYIDTKEIQISKDTKTSEPTIKDVSEKGTRSAFVKDASRLSSIKNVYLDFLGEEEDIKDIKKQIVNALKGNKVLLITEPSEADAVLRSSINRNTNKLFIRLVDKGNHVIWSANIELTNRESIGINVINILTEDINKIR